MLLFQPYVCCNPPHATDGWVLERLQKLDDHRKVPNQKTRYEYHIDIQRFKSQFKVHKSEMQIFSKKILCVSHLLPSTGKLQNAESGLEFGCHQSALSAIEVSEAVYLD